MKKLKNKIFFTILLILTISVLSIITIFTIQNYLEQKNNIESNLNMAIDNAKNSKN
jgi:competence protein ComGC